MGGWGSRVLNLWKCENTRFLRNFCSRYLSIFVDVCRYFHYFRFVSPKPLRWVGGVRCLGLFPKKNRFFSIDPFPKWPFSRLKCNFHLFHEWNTHQGTILILQFELEIPFFCHRGLTVTVTSTVLLVVGSITLFVIVTFFGILCGPWFLPSGL